MNDQSYLLCQECDNVFHKSTAKKSHIRIPALHTGGARGPSSLSPCGSQDKLHMSRENSSGIYNAESALEAHGASAAAALICVVQGLSDTYRAPLVKHGLLDGSGQCLLPDLSASRGTDLEHDVGNAVLGETLVCLLLAGIRGILDDKEVRSMRCFYCCVRVVSPALFSLTLSFFCIHLRCVDWSSPMPSSGPCWWACASP